MLPRFLITAFFVLFMAMPITPTPQAYAQGLFDAGTKQEATSGGNEETPAPAREWTKQQLANIVIEATSPIFTLAEFKTEAELEKAQQLLRDDKKNRQKTLEETFTRDELYALHEFYTTFHGSSIGAKLGAGAKHQILQKMK